MWRIAAVCAISLVSGIAGAAELRCGIATKSVCEPTGCKSIQPSISNKIDTEKRTFSRCEGTKCDDYEAVMTRSGQFLLVEVPGRSVNAKVEMTTLSFHEVASLGHQVFISFGVCR